MEAGNSAQGIRLHRMVGGARCTETEWRARYRELGEEPLLTHENTSSTSLQCQTVSNSDRVSSEERPSARGYRKISAGGLDERDVRIECLDERDVRIESILRQNYVEAQDVQILRESRFYVNPRTREQRPTEAQDPSVQPSRS